jgi:flagellar biosynthetic protein FlhB
MMQDIDLQWFASAEEEGRTEKASDTKLRKAREEGRVAKSQELNGALVMLLPVLCIIMLAPWLLSNCVEVVNFYFQRCTIKEFNMTLLVAFYNYFLKMVLPIAVVAMVAGIVGNVLQTRGFIFTTKTIEPKFSKILPKFGEYFKKTLFSAEGAFNVAKSIIKVIIIFVVVYNVIKNDLPIMLSLSNVSLWQGITHIAGMVAKILVITAVIFLVIAVPDYLIQRRQFMESMKMSKQEVKEEYKNMEGDPLVKSRLRQYMHEIISGNMRQAVEQADVIITNPTHFAVAVQYDKEVMQGPMVTAKGQDERAQLIKRIASENNVTIIENRPLARALYAEVEIGDIIPETYYTALATILGKVYAMKGKKI